MSYDSQNMNEIMKKNNTFYNFDNIIGNNKNLMKTIDFAHKIAHHNSSVLIIGETGTGKELFAQSIHNESKFVNGPFIAVNCAAIPDTLVESVLFGTVQGAFTGAKNNEGLLYQAQNGTIFLDEINSLNLDSQAKLLRFLQDKTIRSVGGNSSRKIFCRIISAVNKDIEAEIKSNKIREDLYYRLATVILNIPPLVERLDDIPMLAKYFINKYSEEFKNNITEVDEELMKLFMNYNWPGNVRELEHIFESALNFVEEDERTLKLKHLSSYLQRKFLLLRTNKIPTKIEEEYNSEEKIKNTYSTEKPLHEILDEVERQIIIERLTKNQGNISQTSKELGIFRQALQYRIKKYMIDEFEYL